MNYNKKHFIKSNDKKLLHKKGKQWIVVGLSALMFMGLGAAAKVPIHASVNENNLQTNVDHNSQRNNVSSNTTIMNQAKNLHNNIVKQNVQQNVTLQPQQTNIPSQSLGKMNDSNQSSNHYTIPVTFHQISDGNDKGQIGGIVNVDPSKLTGNNYQDTNSILKQSGLANLYKVSSDPAYQSHVKFNKKVADIIKSNSNIVDPTTAYQGLHLLTESDATPTFSSNVPFSSTLDSTPMTIQSDNTYGFENDNTKNTDSHTGYYLSLSGNKISDLINNPNELHNFSVTASYTGLNHSYYVDSDGAIHHIAKVTETFSNPTINPNVGQTGGTAQSGISGTFGPETYNYKNNQNVYNVLALGNDPTDGFVLNSNRPSDTPYVNNEATNGLVNGWGIFNKFDVTTTYYIQNSDGSYTPVPLSGNNAYLTVSSLNNFPFQAHIEYVKPDNNATPEHLLGSGVNGHGPNKNYWFTTSTKVVINNLDETEYNGQMIPAAQYYPNQFSFNNPNGYMTPSDTNLINDGLSNLYDPNITPWEGDNRYQGANSNGVRVPWTDAFSEDPNSKDYIINHAPNNEQNYNWWDSKGSKYEYLGATTFRLNGSSNTITYGELGNSSTDDGMLEESPKWNHPSDWGEPSDGGAWFRPTSKFTLSPVGGNNIIYVSSRNNSPIVNPVLLKVRYFDTEGHSLNTSLNSYGDNGSIDNPHDFTVNGQTKETIMDALRDSVDDNPNINPFWNYINNGWQENGVTLGNDIKPGSNGQWNYYNSSNLNSDSNNPIFDKDKWFGNQEYLNIILSKKPQTPSIRPNLPETGIQNYIQFVYEKNDHFYNIGEPFINLNKACRITNGSEFYKDALNWFKIERPSLFNPGYRYVRSTNWMGQPSTTDTLDSNSNGQTYKIYLTSPDIRIHYRWDDAKDNHLSGAKTNKDNSNILNPDNDEFDINGISHPVDRNGNLILNSDGSYQDATPFDISQYINNSVINEISKKLGTPVKLMGYYSVPKWSYDKQNVYIYLKDQNKPVEPSIQPSKPTVQPTKPSVQPSKPTVQPTKPSVQPSKPTVQPTEPSIQPSKPTVQPTKPSVQPSKPTVQPTEPSIQPSKPTIQPTQPIQPSKSSVHPSLPNNGSQRSNPGQLRPLINSKNLPNNAVRRSHGNAKKFINDHNDHPNNGARFRRINQPANDAYQSVRLSRRSNNISNKGLNSYHSDQSSKLPQTNEQVAHESSVAVIFATVAYIFALLGREVRFYKHHE